MSLDEDDRIRSGAEVDLTELFGSDEPAADVATEETQVTDEAAKTPAE